MAAAERFNKSDIGIGENARPRLRRQADEGIVLGRENERGHGDTVDDASAGGAEIVVVGRAESAIGCDDLVIELADRADGADASEPVDAREKGCLAAHAPFEAAQKTPFVDAIGRLMKGIGADGEIDGWTDRGDGDERRTRTPFAGKLEHKIAAHGITDQRDALEAEAGGEMADDRTHVGRAAGVIERGRERFGAAAVAHVHADHVDAGGPCTRGDALNVTGIG